MTSSTRFDHLVRPRHVVTAVLVAHDGARWLPTTLHALKTQRRPIQRFVAVDTGSHDDTRELLERVAGAASVLAAPRRSGFAEAAHRAVRAFAHAPDLAPVGVEPGAPVVEWIWLLHDDSAPSPTALELMLELADDMPSAAVIGPKLRGWDNHRVLLEVGVTVDRGGRRETNLEPGELDHGQHDGDRDVLAVSTAGMLVRRDVWEQLGGLDRALPLFRDDLDFGWRANLAGHRVVVCSRAIVYHAEAAASGVRHLDCAPAHPRRVDRQAALRTMLVNAAPAWLPWIATRLLLACVLRALAFVLTKRPVDGWDETRAAVAVFGRPRALLKARAARKPTRVVRAGDVRRLLAPRGSRLRHYAESISGRMAAVGTENPADSRGFFRRVVSQPGVLLVGALLIVALVAERHVLSGDLYGGALLPAPPGASDLWRTYTEHWHPTGFGSSVVAPPYLALLAILATILFGSAHFAVQVLILGSVPLAGLTAYIAAKPIASTARLRVWLAATYALLPVVTGSVSSGRLGTSVVVVLLPLVLSAMARALLPALAAKQAGRRRAGAASAWIGSLVLMVAMAFDPIVYVLLGPVLVGALLAGVVRRSFVAVSRALVFLVVPPVLLLPWTARLISHPALIASGLGQSSSGLQAPRLAPIDVLLLHPGGPGMPPAWLYVVVVLAGLAGLLQLTRPGPARLGWVLALIGLIGGLVISHARVDVPGGAVGVAGWPGTATAVIGAGVLMSAAVAGARLRARLATTSFGWRQPVALVMAAAAVATPVVAGALWLGRGTGPLLQAGSSEVLPAFVRDPSASQDQPRTIVLRSPTAPPTGTSSAGADTVSYALLRDRSPRLGDADLPPDPNQVRIVDAAVADLAGGFGQRAAVELAHAGIRYVLTPLNNDGGLGTRIATAGGLLPKTTDSGWRVWQVQANAGRLMVAAPDQGNWQLPSSGGGVGKDVKPITVPYAPVARLLVLAEAPSSDWRAVAVGDSGKSAVPLASTTQEGMQAFEIPTAGADIVVRRAPDRRADWLVFQLIALLVVIGAAIPGGRRTQQREAADAGAGVGDPSGRSAAADHAVGAQV